MRADPKIPRSVVDARKYCFLIVLDLFFLRAMFSL